MTRTPSETPLMKQYNSIKRKYPDAILLFRVGDFYETFSSDAILTAKILGITLTKRANGASAHIELAGFPYHALETYLPRLIRAGKRVAVCDQLENPSKTKKIVKRGVTELVTPGLTFSDNVLLHNENNFLGAVHFGKESAGVSFLDISTGEFYLAEGSYEYVDKLLNSFNPKEVLYQKDKKELFQECFEGVFHAYPLDEWIFVLDTAQEKILKRFEVKTLKGFGIETLHLGIVAAGTILHYLDITENHHIKHIHAIARIEEEKYVWLDRFTIRNLELFSSPNEGAKTLFEILNQTVTPMGGRLLRRWIALPLKQKKLIEERLENVTTFMAHHELAQDLDDKLSNIGDIERIISKTAVGRVSPRELVQLKESLSLTREIKMLLSSIASQNLKTLESNLNPLNTVIADIDSTVKEDAPFLLSKGNIIKDGVSEELDEYRQLKGRAKEHLNAILEREMEQTGISSLKISYNNVFGYYLEVRNTHKDKVPAEWIRKQTLTTSERYITEELKELETKIISAEAKIDELEVRLFQELVSSVAQSTTSIQLNASIVAELDCLVSFMKIALDNNYVKPQLDDSFTLDIKNGRHPVIEQQLPVGEAYIANDLFLDSDTQQVIILTGPNMSGKSALLRQSALIVLMAQIGCFVPAEHARIGIVDKIFTRVGASDNISQGESTFMVEMNEAASILNNLSERSLVLFDELGRGTSTYDGISIAWSIVEYIHNHPKSKARTLFATHYHELSDMEGEFERIKNFHVSVKELGNRIVFLRKLMRGGSNHSFGIHVAKMAGMPQQVIEKANEVLAYLERTHQVEEPAKKSSAEKRPKKQDPIQLSFFKLDDPNLEEIRETITQVDINTLTPLEALNKLDEIKKIATRK